MGVNGSWNQVCEAMTRFGILLSGALLCADVASPLCRTLDPHDHFAGVEANP